MGTSCLRWAGAGASDNTDGNVAISNPDKIIASNQSQDLLTGANTGQAHFTLTPGQSSYWHKCTQFKAGSNICPVHADATIVGVNAMLHIYQAGDDASANSNLEIFEWCPIIGGTLRTDLKVSCSYFLRKASSLAIPMAVIGSRGADTKPDEDFGGLTRAQVVADTFGIAYRVRNTDGSKTSTVVNDAVHLWIHYTTPDYALTMTTNCSDETGATSAGQVPYMLHADLYASAFKDLEPYDAMIRWRLRNPSNNPIPFFHRYMIDELDLDDVVLDARTDLRGLQQAFPLEEAGIYTLEAFLYVDGVIVDSTGIVCKVSEPTTFRYVDGTNGSDSNAGTSTGVGNAWATAAKAAASAPSNCIIEFEGGNTYGRSATDFAQDNICLRTRNGTGTAVFENDGVDSTSWGVFTGDRVFIDGRNITVADSTLGGNSYLAKNIFQTTGDDICIWGCGSSSKIAGFHRYGNNSTVQNRILFFDCDLSAHQTVTYFYLHGSSPGSASRIVFTGIHALSADNASSNGFIRIGGPGVGNSDAGCGITLNHCSVDCATNIGADPARAWAIRLNGSLCQQFGCAVTGTHLGNPIHYNPGSTAQLGNWGHLIEGCYCRPTLVGEKVTTAGRFRTYRSNVIDNRTTGEEFVIYGWDTITQVRIYNNTILSSRNFPGAMISDACAPFYLSGQTKFSNNLILGDADNGPNGIAYSDDQLAGSGWGTGTSNTHLDAADTDYNIWLSTGLHGSTPFTVAGSSGLISVFTGPYGANNAISSSLITDYPAATFWVPDADATEARAGTVTVVAPVDFRGIMRTSGDNWLGATSNDAANPDLPAVTYITDLVVNTNTTQAILGWTASGNSFPQYIQRKIRSTGTWYTIGSVASGVETFTDTANE